MILVLLSIISIKYSAIYVHNINYFIPIVKENYKIIHKNLSILKSINSSNKYNSKSWYFKFTYNSMFSHNQVIKQSSAVYEKSKRGLVLLSNKYKNRLKYLLPLL